MLDGSIFERTVHFNFRLARDAPKKPMKGTIHVLAAVSIRQYFVAWQEDHGCWSQDRDLSVGLFHSNLIFTTTTRGDPVPR